MGVGELLVGRHLIIIVILLFGQQSLFALLMYALELSQVDTVDACIVSSSRGSHEEILFLVFEKIPCLYLQDQMIELSQLCLTAYVV